MLTAVSVSSAKRTREDSAKKIAPSFVSPNALQPPLAVYTALEYAHDGHNADFKPFLWTAPANTIISKHQRGNHVLESTR